MWFLILFLLLVSPALAQDSSSYATTVSPEATATSTPIPPTPTPNLFAQYKTDYLFQYDAYQQSYLKYIDKKRVWTKYGTITTQKDKFTAAIDAIHQRNKAFKSYLMALRVMLDEYKSVNPTATEKSQIEISKWESWFTEQLNVVPSINNEADLNKWVDDFKEKYITIQQTIYSALVQHEINLRQQTLETIQSVGMDIKTNPHIQTESQQWINTLAIKSDLVTTGLNTALTMSQKSQNQNKFNNFYPSAKVEMTKANDYLIEITTDLKLIVSKFYKP